MTNGNIFFSYAWDDNTDAYVGDFVEAFVRRLKTRFRDDRNALIGLGVQEVEDLVFFDGMDRAKMGDTAEWLAERAELAQYLVLFVGDAYLRSKWCLFEWEKFQHRLGDEAKRRVLIVELVKNALEEEVDRLRDQQNSAANGKANRLNLLKNSIRNEFFYPSGKRIDARSDRNGETSLATEFIGRVYELADEIVGRLIECSPATRRRTDVARSCQAHAKISEKIRDELRSSVKEILRKQGIEIGDKVRTGEFSHVFAGYDSRTERTKVAKKFLSEVRVSMLFVVS